MQIEMLDVMVKQMQEDSQWKSFITEILVLKNYCSGTKPVVLGYHICSQQSHYTVNNVISFLTTKINNSLSMPLNSFPNLQTSILLQL